MARFTKILLALLSLQCSLCVVAQESTLYQNAPDGWRAEVIPFPLEFAPDIDLNGVEELRFAPGMFEADSPTYFTYTFLWWLEGKQVFDATRLSDNLLLYFQGLYKAVSKEQQDISSFSVSFNAITDSTTDYSGTAEWIDPFVTEDRLMLNIQVEQWFCSEQEHTAVFFRLSPEPYAGENWRDMAEQRAGQCK